MRESRDSDRFLVNTQVQSHALLCRGFGTSVPFIDHMVPMCIMEVASRHKILLTSPPPTVAPVDSECVSIMGLPLPFQVSVSSHWIRPGSCDPFTETYV